MQFLQAWLTKYDDLVFPIGLVLGARLALSLFGAFITSTTVIPFRLDYYNYALVPVPASGWTLWIAPFERWDAIWYELVAARGYSVTDQSAAFFPLFPILVRLTALGTDATLLAGVVVATLCTTLSFILFYRIAGQLFNKNTARLGLVAWAAFPTGFYLFIPYAETLFVLLAIVCLQAARDKHWLQAGVVGGLAALTRSPGLWLVIPLGIAWLDRARTLGWNQRVQTLLPLALVPMGLLLYMLYLQITFGDALLWVHALALWDNHFTLPWDTIAMTVRQIIWGIPGTLPNNLLDLGASVFVLAMVVSGLLPADLRTLSRRGWQPRLPLLYGVYGLVFLVLPLTVVGYAGELERTPMSNAARRALVIFPAFMMAGAVLQGRFRAPLAISVMLGLQCIFYYFFVRWFWVD